MPNIIPPFDADTDRGYKFLPVFDQYFLTRSGRLVLWVEGGVAPYDWEVDEGSLTLDDAQTNVQYNFIEAASDAPYEVVNTITITDAENNSVEIECCTCGAYNCCIESTEETTTGIDFVADSFAEVDSGNDITVAASKITVSTMQKVAISHVTKNYGADYWGDFKIREKVTWTAGGLWSQAVCLGVSNSPDFTFKEMSWASEGLATHLHVSSGPIYYVGMLDFSGGGMSDSYSFGGSAPGAFWIEMERASTTATLKIYSDAFSTLIDTLTITCAATTYDSLIAVASSDYSGSTISTFDVEDLQIISDNPSYDASKKVAPAPYPGSTLVKGECYQKQRVKEGCPPFRWESNDLNFTFGMEYTNSRTNTIFVTGSIDGDATVVTVTDGCGNTCSWTVWQMPPGYLVTSNAVLVAYPSEEVFYYEYYAENTWGYIRNAANGTHAPEGTGNILVVAEWDVAGDYKGPSVCSRGFLRFSLDSFPDSSDIIVKTAVVRLTGNGVWGDPNIVLTKTSWAGTVLEVSDYSKFEQVLVSDDVEVIAEGNVPYYFTLNNTGRALVQAAMGSGSVYMCIREYKYDYLWNEVVSPPIEGGYPVSNEVYFFGHGSGTYSSKPRIQISWFYK